MKKLFLSLMLYAGTAGLLHAEDIGTAAQDSIGLERKDDKTYILHQVDPSQTLYAISKRYNININLIAQSNPAVDFSNLRVGQIIRVPYIPKNTVPQRPSNTAYSYSSGGSQQGYSSQPAANSGQAVTASGKKQIGYMVKSGDSMYGIAQRFNMKLERLQAINRLPSNNLQPGQILLVEIEGAALSSNNGSASSNQQYGSGNASESNVPTWAYETAVQPQGNMMQMVHTVQSEETLGQIAYRYGISEQQIRALNPTIDFSRGMPVGRNILVTSNSNNAAPAANTNAGTQTQGGGNASYNTIGSSGLPANRKITGIAAKITGNTAMESNKHLALHSTASEGTYIKVTNPNNGQYTLVRVVGRLSGGDARNNVAIKLSDAACKALGVIDSQFQVIMEYNE